MSQPSLPRAFTLSDFNFELPPQLIAQHPAAERSGSRLLDGSSSTMVNRIFRELPELLKAGDLLVFNDTKVIKARIFGEKASGGKLELLIERVLPGHEVVAHMKVSKKPLVGGKMFMAGGSAQGGFDAVLLGRWPDANGQLFHLQLSGEPHARMEKHGHVPLPPYITHTDSEEDAQRYQTVFARAPGAVAAPTAALHFDEALLAQLDARGVQRASVTLHVGAGTFRPVRTDDIKDHKMHYERFTVSEALCQAVKSTHAAGKRVIAVGTTALRSLESAAVEGELKPCSRETDIFIYPGYQFQICDGLITNFHLPESTLLMLVSAFIGYEQAMALYRIAIAERYRFFSYGDVSLLLR